MANLDLISNQDNKIEQLLQNGFDNIIQAFEMKKISNNNLLKEKEEIINEINNNYKILKKENEILKKENKLLNRENEKIKNENYLLKNEIKSNSKSVIQIKKNINSKIKKLFDQEMTLKNKTLINELNNEKTKNGYITDRNNLDNILFQNNLNLTQRIDKKKNSLSPGINEIRIPLNNLNTYSSLNSNNIPNKKNENLENNINTLKRNFSGKLFISNIEKDKFDIENLNISTGKINDINLDKKNISFNNSYINNKKNIDIPKFKIENLKEKKNFSIENSNQKIFNNEFVIYTTNLRQDSDYSNNTKQNENLTNFLNQCKIFLTPRNFELIVNIFQKYKDGYINEENVVIQTKKLLQNNLNLIKLFDSLFIVE